MNNELPLTTAAVGGLRVESLDTRGAFLEADALYTRVFRYGDPGLTLNSNLLSALTHNGGSAVGVRSEDGRLIGFAYGFPGTDGLHTYHYSQAAVVDPEFQGRGVGRLMKNAQRDIARRWGAHAMRWTYDPMFARNGHFNLDTLGGIGIRFILDYYGRPDSDRVLVEWPLDDTDAPISHLRHLQPDQALARQPPGVASSDGDHLWIPITGSLHSGDPEPPAIRAERERLRATLIHLYHEGMQLISCRRVTPEISAYLAVAAEDASATGDAIQVERGI